MNRPNEIRTVFVSVDLAREGDFALGALRFSPSVRRVSCNGREEAVQPRVMQVLVALVRAKGGVVSREELIETCWDGMIVGDDSITHSIAKVRQLADFGGTRAFEIETIPRVGYRLRECRPAGANTTPAPVASSPARAFTVPWRWLGWAAGATVIAAVFAAAFYLRNEPEWMVAESHLPFISTPLIERHPALAPDGTMLAYSAGPTTHDRQIYLRLLNGGEPIQLTHGGDDASAPAWSPDGRMIAYVLYQHGHPCRIMEIPVPAGQPHQLGQCRINERTSLAFDPSGRALYFSDAPSRDAAVRIVKLDFDDGRVSPVTHPQTAGTNDDLPSVSRDGAGLLYSRDLGPGGVQARFVSLSDGADRLVAAADSGNASADFSADGRTIFVSLSRDNDNSLWAYPARGGEPRRILSTGESLGKVSAGPNGLLALELEYPGGQLVRVTPHSNMPPRPIASGGVRTWCVDYAPDGTFLATGWNAEGFGIWISSANGSLRELLPLPDGIACAIRWSPDGTRFAFIQWRQHRNEVPVMTRGGQLITRFHYGGNDTGRLDWTADGKSILTSRVEKQGWRIWRTDLATPGSSVPITPFGWDQPCVHGNVLFAQKLGVAGIWRVGETPQRVTDGPAPDASDVYAIAGDRLIYSDTTDPDHPVFSAQNINGGPKEQLAPLPNGQAEFTFGVDPKSGDIVYTMGTNDTDIGLLRLVRR